MPRKTTSHARNNIALSQLIMSKGQVGALDILLPIEKCVVVVLAIVGSGPIDSVFSLSFLFAMLTPQLRYSACIETRDLRRPNQISRRGSAVQIQSAPPARRLPSFPGTRRKFCRLPDAPRTARYQWTTGRRRISIRSSRSHGRYTGRESFEYPSVVQFKGRPVAVEPKYCCELVIEYRASGRGSDIGCDRPRQSPTVHVCIRARLFPSGRG